jgi:capsular exopolysaccharide synthesis family protein
MPFLGEVPPALRKEAAKDVIDKIVRIKPEDLMAEVFRNIRVNVLFSSTEEKPMDAIMVSSSVLSEGKTFVAANMAITFAQAHKGDNTLLIDGDMRRGELGEFFNIGGGKGLSEYLKGEASVDDIIYSTDIENFSVIPSGEHLDNPEELLKSEKLGELVKAAKGKFKRIIIDVPAIMDFEDIKHWGKVCDGLVYVIGSGYTPLEDVFEAKKKLEGKIDIAGGVLNHVAVETDFYYYWRYFQFYLQNKLWQMKQK